MLEHVFTALVTFVSTIVGVYLISRYTGRFPLGRRKWVIEMTEEVSDRLLRNAVHSDMTQVRYIRNSFAFMEWITRLLPEDGTGVKVVVKHSVSGEELGEEDWPPGSPSI